jgi:hypothetical protein
MAKGNSFRFAGLLLLALLIPFQSPARAQSAAVQFVDQGANWTNAQRKQFYNLDQGSRIIPYAWIAALKLPDGRGFLDDGLARYGYFPNPDAETPGLPAGFHTADLGGVKTLGLTCAGCHARQIEAGGVSWRIDGGPAITDFQAFLADLDAAMGAVTVNDAAFKEFSERVLGSASSDVSRKQLRADVDAWFLPYHAIMSKALPTPPWGPGRADAVSMIFNRVGGLDIGPGPTHIIEENIAPADAPVRYPFVWNAPRQDFTQWPGFAKNGDDLLGLARNLGEVFGVFGVYHPAKDAMLPGGVNFQAGLFTPNFPNLLRLESLVRNIGPPKWPWKIDAALAAKGKEIFDRDPSRGGCGPGCHEVKAGAARLIKDTWATPVQDVGTDSREYSVIGRQGVTGELEGAAIPPAAFAPLKHKEPMITILAASVFGSIEQEPLELVAALRANPRMLLELPFEPLDLKDLTAPREVLRQALSDGLKDLYSKEVAALSLAPAAPPSYKYEAKVLEGVWAAAPYLHNGSVPTLAELLKPSAERASSFRVGPAYDIENVGLSQEQTKFDYVYQTTGCEKRDSGVSRCGHEFGVKLSPDEKKALLEYLKQL